MSTNKTLNYGLNQWVLSDKPVMDEFNEDNRKVDEALGDIDKELTNKVSKMTVITSGDITDLCNYPSGHFYIGPDVTGQPRPNLSGLATTTGNGNAVAITMYEPHVKTTGKAITWQKYGNGEFWSPWVKLATAEPPKRIPLPVASNYEDYNGAYYYKTQENIVHVIGAVKRKTGVIIRDDEFANLPVGYRPSVPYEIPCVLHSPDSHGLVVVLSNGFLGIRHSVESTANTKIFFEFSFLAEH